ncbi:hypothetical protein N7451_007119 [Penicillium sp. IBT 35674x]|nr:hypothetical protein N7451_007119 [Penicillium sp. IBT 35674x]
MISRFAHADLLPWLSSGYALGAMNILPSGKSFGVFDLKWTYILTVGLFEVGSAICGAAPNMTALIIGRVIAGIGGSGMYLGCITYLVMIHNPREGPHYIGLVGFVWGIGTVLGLIVGGAFADSAAGWRWTCYINLLIAALFTPVYLFLLPNIDAHPTVTLFEKHRQVDRLSIIFLNGFATCFVMAINFGGAVYDWESAQEIVFWVMTAVICIGFVLVQYFHPFVKKEQVLFPSHLLNSPLMLNLSVQMFLSSGVPQGAIYYIPLYFEFAKVCLPSHIIAPFTFRALQSYFQISRPIKHSTPPYGFYLTFPCLSLAASSTLLSWFDLDTTCLGTSVAERWY